jgi:23S rRNA (uracil1939-C5)-methyltransferase
VASPVAVIDRLAFGGNGVCRVDGKVCFVPFSCPGDEVRLKISAQKKSYSTADIIELISPSPLRTSPVCPIFGSCGGCNWQHISYPVQLEQKLQIFADSLWRGARVGREVVRDVIAAPDCYGYRSRVQFKVSAKQDKIQIGFFRHGSHVVEDCLAGCPVAVPQIDEMLERFRAQLPAFPELDKITHINIDSGKHLPLAVVNYSGKNIQAIKSFLVERSVDLLPGAGLFLQTTQNSIPEHLAGSGDNSYEMPGTDPDKKVSVLTYRTGGFSQINQRQNVALLAEIRRLGSFKTSDKLLDLYCGNGNFTIPLATEVASVLGIEGFQESIKSAEHNLALNSVHNVEFICEEVCAGLKRLVKNGRKFDVILLDPPRAGAGEAVLDIVSLDPARIIYVSCDPSTLARDCGLLSGYGYRVVESVPVDMFPQTYHLESVTLLEKL